MNLLRIETVRTRLALWYVSVLAVILILVGGLIYVLLARALYARIDDSLESVMQIAMTSLANDLTEGQDREDAARSTAAELASPRQLVTIYDDTGRLLARRGPDDALAFSLPDANTIPGDAVQLLTVGEAKDLDDRHQMVGAGLIALSAHLVVQSGMAAAARADGASPRGSGLSRDGVEGRQGTSGVARGYELPAGPEARRHLRRDAGGSARQRARLRHRTVLVARSTRDADALSVSTR